MSDDNTPFNFGKLVPGFDFLQNLTKNATQSLPQMPQLPQMGSWIAPTLSVEELDKRITDLKAVQLWLDQNAMALKATIQALEVQKMTLATLKGMNFSMGDVANAFKLKAAEGVMSGVGKASTLASDAAGGTASAFANLASKTQPEAAAPKPAKTAAKAAPRRSAAAPAAGVVDPLQWWGALTQQFQQIAAGAMKDAAKQTAIDTTKHMATGLAKEAFKSAGKMASGMVGKAGRSAATRSGQAVDTTKKIAGSARSAWSSALNDLAAPARSTPQPVASKRSTARKAPAKTARRK